MLSAMPQRIVVLGAGGFAREVRWLIEEIDAHRDPQHRAYEFLGYVVSDLSVKGEHDSQDEILGDYAWLEQNRDTVNALAIGIGTPAARLKVFAELLPSFPAECWPALVHPSARFDKRSCEIGAGAIICANVIGTVNLTFGPLSVTNLNCTVGHESKIGRGSVLNPTVNISGGVVIGEGCLIGTGAQILQYLHVGDGATVAAGSAVLANVRPGATVMGVPAKEWMTPRSSAPG
jgi:sugar O-acyltransferase (sialic acid O-acetyltransferase NeuD family)